MRAGRYGGPRDIDKEPFHGFDGEEKRDAIDEVERMASGAVACAFCALVLGSAMGPGPLAQGTDRDDQVTRQLAYTKASYTKYDYRIPMRPGLLFTTVYAPKDAAQTYPLLMKRTPYSIAPYGIDNYLPVLGPSEACEKAGFIFVIRTSRERFMSEGELIDMPYHKTRFEGPRTSMRARIPPIRSTGSSRTSRTITAGGNLGHLVSGLLRRVWDD